MPRGRPRPRRAEPEQHIHHRGLRSRRLFRRIAEAIGRGLDVPVHSVAAEQAAEYVGFLAPFVALDNPTSAAKTSELLDWQPTHPGLLDDLADGHYFRTAA